MIALERDADTVPLNHWGSEDRLESLFLLDMDQCVHQIQRDSKDIKHDEIATADFT